METFLQTDETSPQLMKPTFAIVLKPKFGKMTRTARQLLNVLMFLSQQMMKSEGGRGQATFESFSCPVREVLDLLTSNDSGKIGRTNDLKDVIRVLQTVRVEWTAPDANESDLSKDRVLWSSFVILSRADILVEGGVKKLKWSFAPGLAKELHEPERYTKLWLNEINSLNSYCAIALYEICYRYRTNPSKVTSEHTTHWWCESLLGDSKINSLHDLKNSTKIDLVKWNIFKRDYLYPAIKFINTNSMTPLLVELIEVKSGRLIAGVKFKIDFKTPQDSLSIDNSSVSVTKSKSVESSLLNNREHLFVVGCTHLGLSEKFARSCIKKYDFALLEIVIVNFENRIKSQALSPINNPQSYFLKIIESLSVGDSLSSSEINYNQLNHLTDIKSPIKPSSEELALVEKAESFDECKLKYLELDTAEKEKYQILVFDSLLARGLMTKHIKQNLAGNFFGGGVALAEFRRMLKAGI